MIKYDKNRKGVSLIIFVFGIFAILGFTALSIDLGMTMLAQNQLQKTVESCALVGASNVNPQYNTATEVMRIDTSNTAAIVTDTFNKMNSQNALVSSASLTNIEVNPNSKAVRVTANANAITYIMGAFGINSIRINARAAAISAPIYLSPYLPRSPAVGSLINSLATDTTIRQPIGNNNIHNNAAIQYNNIYGSPDGRTLSLGPAGYVTIRLPAPLEDLPGPDLYIKENGNPEGYFVFAGIPTNAATPYVDAATPGTGINWVNISCTGIPVSAGMLQPNSRIRAYESRTVYNGTSTDQIKFYGSGMFDIGMKCYNSDGNLVYDGDSVRSATYLKIIDDGIEDGFVAGFPRKPVILMGEHSSITAGSDIDSVGVLHHTRLINTLEYTQDTDGDGVINFVEDILGTNKNSNDTDGDGISDLAEYVGWYGPGTPISDGVGSNLVYFTDPKANDNNGISKIILP